MLKFKILIVLIASVSSTFGWILLDLDDGVGKKETDFVDFDPSTTKIEMRLTQLLDPDNLAFSMTFLFCEEERQSTLIGTLFFSWNTKSGRKSNLYLSISETFTDCMETQPDMLLIPALSVIDLNTDYLVENDEQYKGNFKDNCEEVGDWSTWRGTEVSKIKKLKVKLVDDNHGTVVSGYTALKDYYTVEYRLIQACPPGQYLSKKDGCTDCSTDSYYGGGFADSCTKCPTGKTVAAGSGIQESDCTWKACPSGQYLDQTNGCTACSAGQYSAGGSVASCTPCDADKYSAAGSGSCTGCPTGKTVGAGAGTQESDCTWKACPGGKYLDQTNGCTTCSAGQYSAGGSVASCTPCDADKYSAAGSDSCTDCPTGKTVAAGKGTQESDCLSGDVVDDPDSGASSIGIRTTGVLVVLLPAWLTFT